MKINKNLSTVFVLSLFLAFISCKKENKTLAKNAPFLKEIDGKVIDSLKIDLNNDGIQDIIQIQESINDSRIIVIKLKQGNKYVTIAENNKIIACKTCGYQGGDPYINLNPQENGFNLNLEFNSMTFRYDSGKIILESVDITRVIQTQDSINEKHLIKTSKDFGQIELAKVDLDYIANLIDNNDSVISNETVDKIKGYFNNDNLEDYIIKDFDNKDSYFIFINNGNGYTKQTHFIITENDFNAVDNSLENLFISNPKKGEILIGVSCCGRFKSTETNYYKFFDEINNWIFYKTSLSTIESDLIPKIELNYLNYNFLIDGKTLNNNKIKNSEFIKIKKKYENYFNSQFSTYKKASKNNTSEKINGNLNFDDLAELLYFIPINNLNINNYNDFAYYIGLCKDGKASSIFLLNEIIKKEPTRIVAYLNLGDAQWGFDENDNAKKSYLKYISLMKAQGKDLNKIPKRVYERIK